MSEDPLASATLARLYLEQGHLDRARGVIRAALERSPFDGRALVLAERLETLHRASLVLSSDGERLVARWHYVPRPRTAYMTIQWFDDRGEALGGHTLACETTGGEREFPWPSVAAAAAAAIRRCDGDRWIPVAVARAVARRDGAP
ncbi:MAG: tetratricopeptide repeat protein [Deltaproteobacteria bacterium]|nr:MAG: tetratricopeptide repeat protein [Deltaproteobacteria bacterium]